MDKVRDEDKKDHLNLIDVHQQDNREWIQLNWYKFACNFVLFITSNKINLLEIELIQLTYQDFHLLLLENKVDINIDLFVVLNKLPMTNIFDIPAI